MCTYICIQIEKNRDRESERKIEVGDVRPPLYLGCVDIGPTRA